MPPAFVPPTFVLVRPQLGQNIGAVARAMLNFGLTDLRLVAPRDGWPNPDAGPAASGADAVLEAARVYATIPEAVADCRQIYATTVRRRGLTVPTVDPEAAAAAMRDEPGPAAVLFGAERSGLETDEAAHADRILTIPINPAFGSLNLAQAALVVAYEWSRGSALATPTDRGEADPPAPRDELDGLIDQFDRHLDAVGYYHPPDRIPVARRALRTLLTHPRWSAGQVRALRGMLRAIAEPRPPSTGVVRPTRPD